MGFILSLLLKLDAAIQQRFDSICFFLMRRFGVRKSMIRYALAALGVIGFVSSMAQAGSASGRYLLFGIIGFIGAGVMLLEQHNGLNADESAEQDPTACSAADASQDGSTKLLWCLIWLFAVGFLTGIMPTSIAAAFTDASTRELQLVMCGTALYSLMGLALEYLKKTPMNPPAEKARERAESPRTAPAQT